MEGANEIDFTFLDVEEKRFAYSVLIILSGDIEQGQISLFLKKSDYVICVDEAANKIYNMISIKGETIKG